MSQPGIKDPAEIEEPELPLGLDAEEVDAEVSTTETDEEVVASPVDELAELKKQLEDANRRAADAESRANTAHSAKTEAENRVTVEVNSRFAAQENAVESRLNAAKSTLTNAKTEIARAYAEQRYEDIANLQETIADAKLEERQAAWEKSQITNLKNQAELEVQSRSRDVDPTEAFIKTIPGGPSKQWLRDHPEILKKVVSSPTEQKRLFGAAQLAEADGHALDSPGYFNSIEKRLGLIEEEPVKPVPKKEVKPEPKDPGRTANAAPGNRSAQSSQPSRVVKLEDVVRKLTDNDRSNARVSFPDKTQEEAEKLFAQGLVISKQREPNFRPDIRL